MMCLLALFVVSLAGCKKEETCNCNNNGNTENPGGGGSGGSGGSSAEYLDMGLPSGTKWKSTNEMGNGTGLYGYDEAVSLFGSNLPTLAQWQELSAYCTCEWQSNGMLKVTGNNGNSILLPAAGMIFCDGSPFGAASEGYYWSEKYNNEVSYIFFFHSHGVDWAADENWQPFCSKLSVRLVNN